MLSKVTKPKNYEYHPVYIVSVTYLVIKKLVMTVHSGGKQTHNIQYLLVSVKVNILCAKV